MVGALDRRVHAVAGAQDGHADADGQAAVVCIAADGVRGDGGAQAFGDGLRLCRIASGQHNEKLFAAVAAHGVVAAQDLPQRVRDGGQGIVTGRTFLGSAIRFSIMIGDGREVLAELPRTNAPDVAVGSAVDLMFGGEPVLVDLPRSSDRTPTETGGHDLPAFTGGLEPKSQS